MAERSRTRARRSRTRLVATDPRNPAPSSEAVRRSMQGNRAKDTGPELLLRKALWAAGVRGYRLHIRVEGVRPDVVFARAKVAVFVHGCFWHRCPYCRLTLPTRNRRFWDAKFGANKVRDLQGQRALRRAGWAVVICWECRIGSNPKMVATQVLKAIQISQRRRLR